MFDMQSPGFGYGYNNIYNNRNYGQYQQQWPQQQQQPIQQTMQQAPKSNMDWIRVSDFKDIQNVQVQPGTKAWIMLQDKPVFVLKSADEMGITKTEAYKFEKYTEEEQEQPHFVTKEEVIEIINKFNAERGTLNESVNEPVRK